MRFDIHQWDMRNTILSGGGGSLWRGDDRLGRPASRNTNNELIQNPYKYNPNTNRILFGNAGAGGGGGGGDFSHFNDFYLNHR